MVIHTTRWSPDTCDCILEYNWDDTTSENDRLITLSNIVRKCRDHNSLTDIDDYNVVFEENRRKNTALQTALENGPTSLFDTDPNGSRILKETVDYNWSLSGTAPNRVLTMSFGRISLTENQKNTVRNALNTRFGSGRTVLQ